MSIRQLRLPLQTTSNNTTTAKTYQERLVDLLSQDLNFHDQDSSYASHNFHSFPAKFPPQLPRVFINELTNPGESILDPMLGSGTTILEAFLTGRRGIGFDIDPLALMISKIKTSAFDVDRLLQSGNTILKQATLAVTQKRGELEKQLENRWDSKSKQFIDYWFAPETQMELLALITEIEKISDAELKAFFELAFSSIIITKSGGVSLALDLGHTRPHRAKIVFDKAGEPLFGEALIGSSSPRIKFLTKTLRPALGEFRTRFRKNLNSVLDSESGKIPPSIRYGDAQNLPLDDASIDLIVTSPPYASNAIDYMRAHKFSLVWLGYPINDLGQKRKSYIGGEALTEIDYEQLPDNTAQVIADLSNLDEKKGRVLHRYYSEMTRVLEEMFRVLRPGKAAILVVGNSVMRGRDTETGACLADIGRTVGFKVPKIGVRSLDRNKRMMPAGSNVDLNSQIQQRMHEEYVIGFIKPQ